LAELFNTEGSRVKIAEVDCTDGLNKDTCNKNGVQGYPTLKFFKRNSNEKAVEYDSEVDFSSLKQFVNGQLESLTTKTEKQNSFKSEPQKSTDDTTSSHISKHYEEDSKEDYDRDSFENESVNSKGEQNTGTLFSVVLAIIITLSL
jgi:Thioredoxin